jgi:hypothetical protein
MWTSKSPRVVETLTLGVLGGFAGGAAEIGWIGLYGAATGTSIDPVARGVVESAIPTMATSAWAVELGVLIHLCLAVALGIALAFGIRLILHLRETFRSEIAFTVLILTAVWAMNFLVVLPYINPAFVHLLPYSVTLLSKGMFGIAAATIFHARRGQRVATASP